MLLSTKNYKCIGIYSKYASTKPHSLAIFLLVFDMQKY